MKARTAYFGKLDVPNPDYGDVQLNVFPGRELPKLFSMWQPVVDRIFSCIPRYSLPTGSHYVTISSKFFTESGYLRREGLHIDGNFCADPTFRGETWGGTGGSTWSGVGFKDGKVLSRFASPYGIVPPIGKYVSGDLGGIFSVSSMAGCYAWSGDFTDGMIGSGGACEGLRSEIDDIRRAQGMEFKANRLYFMTSNTPHMSMGIGAGERRTLIRVTLAHDYPNRLIFERAKDFRSAKEADAIAELCTAGRVAAPVGRVAAGSVA